MRAKHKNIVSFWGFIATAVLLTAVQVYAQAESRYEVIVQAAKVAVEPHLVAINDETIFRFEVFVIDKQDQNKEVPSKKIDQITYNLESDGKLVAVPKFMHIVEDSEDKKARGSVKHPRNANVECQAQFSTSGEHFVTLYIAAVMDGQNLAIKLCRIKVNACEAVLTVYANPPKDADPKPVFDYDVSKKSPQVGLRNANLGHSFWKIEVREIQGKTDQTIKGKRVAGRPFGFYGNVAVGSSGSGSSSGGIDSKKEYPGYLKNDSENVRNSTVIRTYQISVGDAENVIKAILELSDSSKEHKYQIINKGAKNCTGQAVFISREKANCTAAPEGMGIVGWNLGLYLNGGASYTLINNGDPFCNPYHHAEQLKR